LKVVGVGNRWRGDDAAGLEVVARLAGTLPAEVELVAREGEPTSLVDDWEDAGAVWLVDAVVSGTAPGTLHRVDVREQELPAELFRASTHHFGLAETVELARALGRLPQRLVVLGIEGERFTLGEGLSPAVDAAVDVAVASLREEVLACTNGR
jgi:hydrogenase maturation protease